MKHLLLSYFTKTINNKHSFYKENILQIQISSSNFFSQLLILKCFVFYKKVHMLIKIFAFAYF